MHYRKARLQVFVLGLFLIGASLTYMAHRSAAKQITSKQAPTWSVAEAPGALSAGTVAPANARTSWEQQARLAASNAAQTASYFKKETNHFSDKAGPFEVQLVPQKDVTALNETTIADLHVRARVPTGPLHVSVSATGAAATISPAAFDLAALLPNGEATAAVRYVVSGSGEGELRVSVTGAGVSQSALIYVHAGSGEALHERSGPLDLRLKRVDRDHASGRLSDATYTILLDVIAGGGALERAGTKKSRNSGTVSGAALWTDRAGGTHPIRLARVELRDQSDRSLLATSTTARDGSYTLATPRRGSFFVRVLCQEPGVVIRSSRGTVQHIDSFAHPTDLDLDLSLDITANNVDDNNTAFSVADALLTEDLYLEQTRGTGYPSINVVFPSPLGTFFNPRVPEIQILRLDRFDWDVSMHEFGHYVAQKLRIDRSPGGGHFPGFNLSELNGKPVGITLAWSEGWATYFGTSVQQVMGTASLGIPFVGDTHYTDTEDFDFDYDLETQTGGFPGFVILSVGEDDEASVQRILWDLFDTADDDGDHGVALGDTAIISALESNQAGSLSEAFAALTAGRAIADVAQIGCVLTEHRVAPALTQPADGAVVSSGVPTFEWVPNGAGPSFQNFSFVVEIYDATFTHRLLRSSPQSATTFTPSRSQWNAVVRAANGEVHWLVRGSQLDDPVTGAYVSCPRTFVVQ